ncbi:acetyltransferase [uncultured Aquimarina sp.]|uniref:acetyltransferase n=1 Tax=uncultured Aquimarina sp. TaxID=575652 RepID=UPI00261CA075|nr:acetyltransferase [uncultured Aquimarina sp.]
MDKIVIIGASGHAKVVIETVESNGKFQIYGLIDSFKPKGEKVLGYEILGTEDLIKDLIKKGINKGVIAIGDNWTRYLMYTKIKEMAVDFEFVTIIHSSAIISPSVIIGKGTVILASVKVNALVEIGDGCILNTNASFGHDGKLNDFASIAPGVTVGGNVTVGFCSAVSLGANVIQGVDIGKHSIIGAGSLILHDVDDFNLVYGVPGEVIKTVKKGKRYLSKS